MSGKRGVGRHEPADASGFDGTVDIITIEPDLFEEDEDEGEVQHPGSGGPAPFRLEDEEEDEEA